MRSRHAAELFRGRGSLIIPPEFAPRAPVLFGKRASALNQPKVRTIEETGESVPTRADRVRRLVSHPFRRRRFSSVSSLVSVFLSLSFLPWSAPRTAFSALPPAR